MKIIHRSFCLLGCLILSSCASATVHPDNSSSSVGVAHYPLPHAIYFTADAFSQSNAWKNAAEDASNNWPGKVQSWFDELLPQELKNIAPTQPARGDKHDGWLLETTVTYFDPGSASARLWIGGGAGQSKIKTHTVVYDLTRSNSTPIFSFSSYGDSGNYSSLYEQASLGTGPKKDIWRTCREIRGYIQNTISSQISNRASP